MFGLAADLKYVFPQTLVLYFKQYFFIFIPSAKVNTIIVNGINNVTVWFDSMCAVSELALIEVYSKVREIVG